MKKSEQINSKITELMNKRSELLREILRLEEKTTHTDIEIKNGDVYLHENESATGSYNEIQQVNNKIKELDIRIQELEALKHKHIMEENEYEKNKPEILKSEAEERKRKVAEERTNEKERQKTAFKRIKKIYKSGPLSQRLINLIPGNHTRFGNIKKLSQEEIEFLEKLSKGDTIFQKEKNERRRDELEKRKKKLKPSDIRKMNSNSNWNQFVKAINSKTYLKSMMDMEESKTTGIGRGY